MSVAAARDFGTGSVVALVVASQRLPKLCKSDGGSPRDRYGDILPHTFHLLVELALLGCLVRRCAATAGESVLLEPRLLLTRLLVLERVLLFQLPCEELRRVLSRYDDYCVP